MAVLRNTVPTVDPADHDPIALDRSRLEVYGIAFTRVSNDPQFVANRERFRSQETTLYILRNQRCITKFFELLEIDTQSEKVLELLVF